MGNEQQRVDVLSNIEQVFGAKSKTYAAVAEVFEAIKVYREDYRQSGCPDPACIVCRRSKAAEDRLDTALRNAGVKV